LLHNALRNILGTHVEQKGSLVNPDHLRFDFSHFQKVTDEEIKRIETQVNNNIRNNFPVKENRSVPLQEAIDAGAIAFFGEKYDAKVRTVQFGDSNELCGGTHVKATGQIGVFKIISEGSIAAGIRRIEAVTAEKALEYINEQLSILKEINQIFKTTKDLRSGIKNLVKDNALLNKQLQQLLNRGTEVMKHGLISKMLKENGINIIAEKVDIDSSASLKDLAFKIKNQVKNLFLVLGAEIDNKASIVVMISENLVKQKGLNANTIIREIAKDIDGGGGGQAFFATAGGKNPSGLLRAITKAKKII